MTGTESVRIPDGYAVLACGTLRPELRRLVQAGALDEGRLFFTAPGLHEWPGTFKEHLARQLEALLSDPDTVAAQFETARRHIRTERSGDTTVDCYEQIYDDIIAGRVTAFVDGSRPVPTNSAEHRRCVV